jgi:hypothetical protein
MFEQTVVYSSSLYVTMGIRSSLVMPSLRLKPSCASVCTKSVCGKRKPGMGESLLWHTTLPIEEE